MKQFSIDYLNRFLTKSNGEHQEIYVVVNCNRSHQEMYVNMKIGARGNAIICKGWKKIVNEFKLRRRDICVFSFRDQFGTRFEDIATRLRLVIQSLGT